MQRALNKFKKSIYAWNNLSEYETKGATCPHCETAVRYRNGDTNKAHFAHESLNNCPYSGASESKEHIGMKRNLSNFLKKKYPDLNIELEKTLVPNRRADMVIHDEKQTFVVEFQASSIKVDEMVQRTKDYNNLGYPVLWIFHINMFSHNDFPNEDIRRVTPYAAIKMHELDSLFVMNNKGLIKKCSLSEHKDNTKKVYKRKFLHMKTEFKFNKVMQKKSNDSLFLCQIGKDSIYSENNLYYGYWLLKNGKTKFENIRSKVRDIIPSNVFFKIEKIKYYKTHIEFQIFMEYKNFSMKTGELLITKEEMPMESILDYLKELVKPKLEPKPPKPKPVKDASETVMKEVAASSETLETNQHTETDTIEKEPKKGIEEKQETDIERRNPLKVFFNKIKKIINGFR